jgi:hypothetical protein
MFHPALLFLMMANQVAALFNNVLGIYVRLKSICSGRSSQG